EDRARLVDVAGRAARYGRIEPLREKLLYMRARMEVTRTRSALGYAEPAEYIDDLRLCERTLAGCGLHRLAHGRLRDARRRAGVFGFHLAPLDLRQHSEVHAAACAELLARGGVRSYATLPDEARTALLLRLLEQGENLVCRDRWELSPKTREILQTLDVVG